MDPTGLIVLVAIIVVIYLLYKHSIFGQIGSSMKGLLGPLIGGSGSLLGGVGSLSPLGMGSSLL